MLSQSITLQLKGSPELLFTCLFINPKGFLLLAGAIQLDCVV